MSLLDLIGVETGALSEIASADAGVTAHAALKRTGGYCLRIEGDDSSTVLATTNIGYAAGTIYARFYFRRTDLPSSDYYIFTFSRSDGIVQARVEITTAGALRLYIIGPALSSTVHILVDTWHKVEVKYTKGTGANATGELWVNDTQVSASGGSGTDDIDHATFRARYISAGEYYYFDDAQIRTDAYPGAGQIEALRPNAVGDGDTNYSGTWDDINDDPINEASYRECTAATGTFDDAIDDTDTLTDSLGTINHARVGVWTKGAGASNDQYLRYKNNGAGIQESGNLLVDKVFEYHTYDPGTQPTIAADIDGAQMGMRHDDGKDGTVAEMWLMVDYVPAAPPSGVIQDVIGCGVVPFAR